MAPAQCTAWLFDLDGTLVDSRPSIERSLRQAVEICLPELPTDGLLFKIGPPVREILQHALPSVDKSTRDAIIAVYRKIYDAEGCLQAALYPGVATLLPHLRASQRRAYLVTNKPAAPTRRMINHLGLAEAFNVICCPDDRDGGFRHKHEAVGALLERERFSVQEALLVGDSIDDAEAAAGHGISFIAAAYGYGSAHLQSSHPIHHTVASFSDLLRFAGL